MVCFKVPFGGSPRALGSARGSLCLAWMAGEEWGQDSPTLTCDGSGGPRAGPSRMVGEGVFHPWPVGRREDLEGD